MRTIANPHTIPDRCTATCTAVLGSALLMLSVGIAQAGHHGRGGHCGHGHGHSSFSFGIDLSPRYYAPYQPYYYAYPVYAPVYAPAPYYAAPPVYGYAAPAVQPQAAVAAAPAATAYAPAPIASSSQSWRAQSPTVAGSGQRVEVTLPDPEGEVWVDGRKAKATADGKRVFSLAEGDRTRIVRITAAWHRDGRIVSEERMVDVRPGGVTEVDFSRTQVADRTRNSSAESAR